MSIEPENIVDLFDEFYLLRNDTQRNEEVKAVPEQNEKVTDSSVTEPIMPIATPVAEPVVVAEPKINLPKIDYAGANKKHIAFIYNDKINDSRENVEMISNLIRNALKITMDDVAVIRLSKNEHFSISQLKAELLPKQVVFFGAQEFMPNTQMHQVVVDETCKILVADWVHQYHGKNEEKAKLWAGIQQLFV